MCKPTRQGILAAPDSTYEWRRKGEHVIGYINRLNFQDDEVDDVDLRTGRVLNVLPRSIADHAAHVIGSKKLAEVHAYLATEGELTGFVQLANYAMVLRSKPSDWTRTPEQVIAKSDTKALYLRYMLSIALGQFHQDVNTNHERGQLKRVVAMIKSKRELKKAIPTQKMVSNFVERLDRMNFFGTKGSSK